MPAHRRKLNVDVTIMMDAKLAQDVRTIATMGFRPLKEGRIHMRCDGCGRKQSNMLRAGHDPPAAALMVHPCPKCAEGAMEPPVFYFDAEGRELGHDGNPLAKVNQ